MVEILGLLDLENGGTVLLRNVDHLSFDMA
jgi:hypothetical protein